MDANEYQRRASLTAAPQNDADRAANAVLGLAGEAGELAQLLLDGEWTGTYPVWHALRIIARVGALVEPIKKAVYQGHTWDAAQVEHGLDLLRSAEEMFSPARVLNTFPGNVDLTAVHRKFADELGDAQWYVAQGARAIGWDLGIIMSGNLLKLERRYPDGRFTAEASQGRNVIDVNNLKSIGSGPPVITWGTMNASEGEGAGIDMFTPPPTLPAITGLHLVPSLDGESFTLSWDATGLPYAVELEGSPTMLFCGSGYSSGAWMRKETPYRLRVRLQDGARFGPWSEWVTIEPRRTTPTITSVAFDVTEDDLGTVRVDTVSPALAETDLEWEDNSVYTGYWKPINDWLLPRRWHYYSVRFRWRPAGLAHGDWSEWFIVPARPLPEVRGLRVEVAPNPAPDSDQMTYARLVWENREPEIGYQVEFLKTGNIYDLNSAGQIAQSDEPTMVRVRAAVVGRVGQWSEPVELPLAMPEPTPSIALRISAVSDSARGPDFARAARLVNLVWEPDPTCSGLYDVEGSNTPDFDRWTTITKVWPPLEMAVIGIRWDATPYIRVRSDSGVVSNVVHVPPAQPQESPSEPCQHPMMDVLRRPVVAGRPTVYLRCPRCGVEQWLDEETEQPIGPYQSATAEADRLVEAQRRIREALNQRTVEMAWIVTRDGHNLNAAVRHPTELAAIDEAERLAKKHSQPFLVWQLVGKVEPAEAPVRWVKASDLPF